MTKVVIFIASSLATGASLAQGPTPPTGIQKGGIVTLSRAESKFSAGPLGNIESTTDSLSGGFVTTDYSKVNNSVPGNLVTIGSCNVLQFPVPAQPPADPTAVTPLDAGPVLNVTGPNGNKQIAAMNSTFGGVLGGGQALPIPGLPPPPPLYLDPGSYTVDNGSGGADIAGFMVNITVPPNFVWTNADDAATIDRTVGFDVQWTGGDPTTMVTITGGVIVLDPTSHQVSGGATFSCTANNSDGHFTVTPDVMTLFPASSSVGGVSNGSLSVSDSVIVNFSPTASDGSSVTSTLGFRAAFTRTPTYN